MLLSEGGDSYGFTPVLIAEDGTLPFEVGYFDIVFCSSVIEHVTVSKQSVYNIRSSCEFRNKAYRHQQIFASEIRRLGKCYFVQTPNRWFLFESHTWLPFVRWLPRKLQIAIIRISNKFWSKTTSPDFNLLNRSEFSTLFPDAEIVPEKSLGMVKSWMAIKKE